MNASFERKLNVLVAFPAGELWHGKFGISLSNMLCYMMAQPVPGYRNQRIQPMQLRGSILPRSRHKLVKEAQRQSCSHVLWADTDQTFPRDTCHRLLAHDKDVVGCNIATKQLPATTTARKKTDKYWGESVFTDPDSPPLEKVWRLGTGIMLVKVQVYNRIGANVFDIPWIPEIQDYQGEDWTMCQRMEQAGIDIWVDHKLSNQIGHLGELEYTHDMVGERVVEEVKVIGEA